MLQAHIEQKKSSTGCPFKGRGGTLHKICLKFTQKKASYFHLESERKMYKIHTVP